MKIKDNAYNGIIYMLLSAVSFSVMAAAAKLLSKTVLIGQASFYRNVVGLLILIIWLYIKPVQLFTKAKWGWLIFRGSLGTLGLYLFLLAIKNLPLGTAMTYNLTSTIFIAILSVIFFKEKITSIMFWGILIGFIGMVLVYQPKLVAKAQWHIIGLIAGVISALAYITVGRLTKFFDARLIVGSFLLVGTLVPIIAAIAVAIFPRVNDGVVLVPLVWVENNALIYAIGLGVFAFLGQYFITKAYEADKINMVSVFGYSSIIFSNCIGVALGDSIPNALALLGMSLIIVSGIIMAYQKKKSIE
jgi:drug/metabolite transporter (DMT)-like permease